MRKILLVFITLWLIVPAIYAQKVGLVLSGGGAKGLTHIGIIRALEENNIPIDYIAGTSMGAIIGSLYAMGYSPDDMVELLKSEDFKRWYSGEVEEKYVYHFKKNLPTPEFFNIRFSFRDSLKSLKPQFLPTSVVNPIQMNLVFVDLYARATAACKGDFDKLFVPFRCIASDVYNKKQLIMKEGDLGDAVRASMSFPFMFKPIEIDNVLAYDGGIYNNFPTDVMKNDFHPDIIIGSVVSANPTKPKENDLMSQIENMVMQKTDYSIPDSMGILMTFKYDNVGLMDFQRVDELHDIGYNRTISMMDSIKSRIHRRVNLDNIRLRRMVYRSNYPELRFKNIIIDGANTQQQAYIKKEFHKSDNKEFSYEDLKQGYFRLLSDNMISEIIPHAIYNPEDDTYDLHLKVKLENNFAVRLGGNISTSNSNQIYLGLSYQDLNYYAKEFVFDGQLGKVYNNTQFMAKIDFSTAIPTSYFNGSTLNSRQYPTRGYREALIAQIFIGRERFYPGEGATGNNNKEHHSWLQLSYMKEKYHNMSEHWVLGWYLKALYASKNFSENYTATMMQAGEFSPTQHSKLTYNEAFRANQFVGAGIRPIYRLNQMFHLRGEFYGFMPIYPIERNSLNKAYYGKAFSKFEYLGEISVVCQLPFGDISAYVNHYSSPKREWNVGLSIGWQLFNYRFIE